MNHVSTPEPAPRPEPARRAAIKADAQLAAAVDLARAAAEETAGDFGVGEYLGFIAEGDRLGSHTFASVHPGYRGWYWSVTVVRASRSRQVTVNEVVLLPGTDALVAPAWLPWSERAQPADLAPGMLAPRPNDDPRLEPGYTGGEQAADMDPAEQSQMRAVVAELGLGRERVLAPYGRDLAVERWLAGPGGPHTELARQAPAECASCGFLVRLAGSLGDLFGVCANEYSPNDATVVSIDHGCGAHSDVVETAPHAPAAPVWDTIAVDTAESLFD